MTEPVKQLRLQHFIVQPVIVWDDGTELTPGPPMTTNTVTLSGLADLLAEWPVQFTALAESLNQAEPTSD